MAVGDTVGIGVSGLLAFQRALATVGHNITNSNTVGYSRQRVDLATNPPQFTGAGYVGMGVTISNVRRMYDSFLTTQIQTTTTDFNKTERYYSYAAQLDGLLADKEAGLTPSLQAFFGAVHELSNDPTSGSARQILLSNGNSLVDKFHYLSQRFNDLQSHVNSDIANTVTEINRIAGSIAQLNKDIAAAPRVGGVTLPNDLLDQRDKLSTDLAELVSVTTTTDDDGSMNVFIGNGQALVIGFKSLTMSSINSKYDPTRLEIGYSTAGTPVEISNQLQGGKLGGTLSFRADILDAAQNALGRAAISLADTFNNQHQLGQDANGNLGGDFFNLPDPEVLIRSANAGTGTVSAAFINTSKLTTSNYTLTYNGSNTYLLNRISDNTTTVINTAGNYPYSTTEIDGFNLTLTAGAVAGDSWRINPARRGAIDLAQVIGNPNHIAFAAPIRTQAALTNGGSGKITVGEVNNPRDRVALTFTAPGIYDAVDVTSGVTLGRGLTYTSGNSISFNGWATNISDTGTPPATGDIFYVDRGVVSAATSNTGGGVIAAATLAPPDANISAPVTITFNAPPNTFNVSGAINGFPVTNVSYVPGQALSFNGWTVTISGTPIAGDIFTIRPNTNGLGDNRNGLKLAELQTTPLVENSTLSYQDAYGALVADVGSRTHQLELTRSAQKVMYDQALNTQAAVSGVNLDEEAADLLRFQQAYQAAAKLIATSDSLFQTLLGAVSR